MRTSFWFLPSAMAIAAAGLSYCALTLDSVIETDTVERLGWLYSFGPEGARAVLSTVASSMITVAGLTFSITMLTIQLASSQFGPRLLRNLMRDRSTQVVLGIFVSTFIYCLLVLRTVRGTEGASWVPHLSVALGVFLTLVSLGMLIYFIHHVARSLRLETVLTQLTKEAKDSIDLLYPELHGNSPRTDEETLCRNAAGVAASTASACLSTTSGYVQAVRLDALLDLASRNDLFIEVRAGPGEFVIPGDDLVAAWPADRWPKCDDEIRQCFTIGSERTPVQDLAHSSGRLVEIAQRALSSGVNDPVTAIYCLDRLREILVHLAQREIPSPLRLDRCGQPRIWSEPHDRDAFASVTLADVLRYGSREPMLMTKIAMLADELRSIIGQEQSPLLARLQSSVTDVSKNILLKYDRQKLKAQTSGRDAR